MNPLTSLSTPGRSRHLRLFVLALVLSLAGASAAMLTVGSWAEASASHAHGSPDRSPARAHGKKKPRGHKVSVMTRNLYLGADLGPAIAATSPDQFISENGKILRDVDDNNFPVRAKGLAAEILGKMPDLVGLQEAALWRTGPPDITAPTTGNYTASTVKYDYLKELLGRLNKGRKRYRIVKVQNEFDFEAPADYNNVPNDGNVPGLNSNGEINGRLTMRDAILARVGAGIVTANPRGENYETLYQPTVSGIPITVKRGWVSVDAKVRGARWISFVNTHLESFSDPEIREAQAKELVDGNGPLKGRLPSVLVGDLNSDDNTVTGGDTLAYDALYHFGMRDRGTEKPLSCCIKSDILADFNGTAADFDHHIDQIMTDRGKKVWRLKSAVTGRKPVNGFWDSDHAGVYSLLKIIN